MIAYLLVLFAIYHLIKRIHWDYFVKPSFDGKVVFITGASSGIGEELAKQFVKLNAKTVIIAARRVAELERVKKECQIKKG